MALSLDLLRTFLAVYREGSLTRAAHRLSLAQPTVTVQIRALEAAVGRPLFDRAPRGVTPTAAADLLARRIADPLDELAGLGGLGEGFGGLGEGTEALFPLAGIVQLGGPVEFLTNRVLPELAGLIGQGLELRITLGLADELVRALGTGSIDVAVLTTRPRGRGLRVEPLCDEEFVLVAGVERAEEVLGAQPPTEAQPSTGAQSSTGARTAAALKAVPLISYAEALPIVRRYWRTVFGTRPVREAAVVAGAGYSVLPSYLCADDVAAGRLVVLHDPPLAPLNTLYLATRAGVASSAAAATVRNHLLAAGRHW